MKNKKRLLLASVYIIFTLFSGASLSEVSRGEPNSDQREGFCTARFFECKANAESSCNAEVPAGNDSSLSDCIGSRTHTCDLRFGIESSSCMTDPKIVSNFDKPIVGQYDAYDGNDNQQNNRFEQQSQIPQTGFVASPTINKKGLPKSATPIMNKPLVGPLVVPMKKTSTMPIVSQPQIRTMSAPNIQPKQRVESPARRKVVTPTSSTVPKNKITIKQAVPATPKDVKIISNQPAIHKMNSAPAINGGKSKAVPTTSNNFDEADALFSKRTNVPNTQSR